MNRQIITAIDRRDLHMLERVLQNGANPNALYDSARFMDNETALMHVLYLNDTGNYDKFVEMLLEYGADPDIIDSDGETPLMDMAYQGKSDMVLLLLEYGADPNITDIPTPGDNALIYAIKGYIHDYVIYKYDTNYDETEPDTKSIEYIIEAGSDIDNSKIMKYVKKRSISLLNTMPGNFNYTEMTKLEIVETLKNKIFDLLEKYEKYNPFKRLSVMSSLNSRLGEQSPLIHLDYDTLIKMASLRYDPKIQRQKYLTGLEERATANFLKDIAQYGSGKRSTRSSKRSTRSSKRSTRSSKCNHKKHKKKSKSKYRK